MSAPVGANGENFAYPVDQEVGYASQATGWAQAVTAALNAIGRGDSTSVNAKAVIDMVSTSKGFLIPRMTTVQISAIASPPESLLVYDTTLRVFKYYRNSAWVSVGSYVEGNFDVNGDLNVSGLGVFGSSLSALSLAITNAITAASATLTGAFQALTGIFTDATDATNADTAPLKTLGGMAVKKKLFVGTDANVGGILNVTGATNLTGDANLSGNANLTGNANVGGIIYADDNTTANTPVLSFTGDTDTGIGRSAADTLDFITNGNSRFRIESTGQIKAVYESQVGTDYNTTLNNGYLCRAWVNFNGTLSTPITPRGSGNVSSVTKNGTGDYTINFATAMPDANYCISGFADRGNGAGSFAIFMGTNNATYSNAFTTTSARITTRRGSDDAVLDSLIVCLAVFR